MEQELLLNFEKAYDLVLEKLQSWVHASITVLPNVAVSILIVIAFFVLGRLVQKFGCKLLKKISDNEAIIRLTSSVIFVAVFSIGIFISLSILHLDKAVTSLLAGAGVIGIALGFAFQETTANLISGFIVALRRPFEVGDIVKISDIFGKVDRINLRTTVIRTFDGQDVLIPNRIMASDPLWNFSKTQERRIELEVGVSYGDDLAKVEETVLKALEDVDRRDSSKPVEMFYREFGGSSINFVARYWVEYPGDNNYFIASHDGIKRLKKALDEAGITIPYPIRTLDFGIKGGVPLSKQLVKNTKESEEELKKAS